MSLDYDLTRIKDYESTCLQVPSEGETPVPTMECTALIFSTMPLGLPGFTTEKELDAFYRRLSLYERLFGTSRGEPTSKDTLRKYLGLCTNVSKEPEGRWTTRIVNHWYQEQDERRRQAQAKAAHA